MRPIAALVLCAAVPAFAQSEPYRFEIRVDRPVLEPGETSTVTLLGHYPASGVLPGVFSTGVRTDAGGPVLADPALVAPYAGPATDTGTPGPSGVEGIVGGMLCFPCADCWPYELTSPVELWTATFTAPAAGGPTEVALWTVSEEYLMYREGCPPPLSVIDQLAEAETTITVTPCRADLDGDGVATVFDFLAFMNAFDAGDPLADFDFDGELTVFDFLAFQNRFDAGC